MASTKINASLSSKGEFYSPWAEHSREDIDLVNKLEDEEQRRRIADVLGEQQRRNAAHQVSEIVSTNLRPSWFNKGSAYALELIKMARQAGGELLRSSQVRAMSAKIQVVGQRGIASAQATAQDVKHKAEVVGHRAQERSQEVKSKLHDTIESAENIAQQGIEKVQEITQKIKNVSLKFFGKVSKAVNNLSENTNLAFAVLEEENERQTRLNGELEVYAILNALSVSCLLKETAPALYRPAFEPTRKYSTRLIEEYERQRRNLADAADHTAINNAKTVSQLIQQKFSAPIAPLRKVQAPLRVVEVERKVEVIEAPKSKKPIGAAM